MEEQNRIPAVIRFRDGPSRVAGAGDGDDADWGLTIALAEVSEAEMRRTWDAQQRFWKGEWQRAEI